MGCPVAETQTPLKREEKYFRKKSEGQTDWKDSKLHATIFS